MYDSPNTFVIGVGYSGGFAPPLLATWQNRLTAAFEKRGFYVAAYRFDAEQNWNEITQAAAGRDVWGLAFFGHGYKKINHWYWWSPDPDFQSINGGLAWDKDKEQVINAYAFNAHQKFGLLLAYFCYADLQPWSRYVSLNGRFYGGNGQVSALAGPRGVGYWGSWDSLVGTATD